MNDFVSYGVLLVGVLCLVISFAPRFLSEKKVVKPVAKPTKIAPITAAPVVKQKVSKAKADTRFRWSEESLNHMFELIRGGLGIKEVAKKLKLKEHSVRNALSHRGVTLASIRAGVPTSTTRIVSRSVSPEEIQSFKIHKQG